MEGNPSKGTIITPGKMVSRSAVAQTGETYGRQLFQDAMPLRILRRDTVMAEDAHGEKVKIIRIGGQFQLAENPNANGRIYPFKVLREAVEEIQDDVKGRRVMGEFDHPPDAKVHLDRVSHLITKLWIEGKTVFGECEVLEKLPFGAQLKGLLESKVCIGISSRGVGDMETVIREGQEFYQVLPGYTFITFDIVAEPSVHGSYMSIKEGRDRMGMAAKGKSKKEREADVIAEMQRLLRGGK